MEVYVVCGKVSAYNAERAFLDLDLPVSKIDSGPLFSAAYAAGTTSMKNNRIEKMQLGDTRHISITSMMLQGLSPYTIAQLAGHAQIREQIGYYSHMDTYIEANTYHLSRELAKKYIATRVGKCKHCNKEVTSNIIYVSFPNRTIACQKCYHQSGASLIWLNKPQSP